MAKKQEPIQDDFVSDLIAVVRSRAKLTDEQAAAIMADVRERWGGHSSYIARRPGEVRDVRNAAIRRDFQRGESVTFLSRRYSLSRQTIYNVLGLSTS